MLATMLSNGFRPGCHTGHLARPYTPVVEPNSLFLIDMMIKYVFRPAMMKVSTHVRIAAGQPLTCMHSAEVGNALNALMPHQTLESAAVAVHTTWLTWSINRM